MADSFAFVMRSATTLAMAFSLALRWHFVAALAAAVPELRHFVVNELKNGIKAKKAKQIEKNRWKFLLRNSSL